MDNMKIGKLIKSIRIDKSLTQKQLADIIGISDKAVSKWERGNGAPDLSLLSALANALEISIEDLLSGDVRSSELIGGNMKKSKYYICSNCKNFTISTGDIEVSCCGKSLKEMDVRKAESDQKLNVEVIENDWYITSSHPMTKDHYISMICFATSEKIEVVKTYPEWNLNIRIPKSGRGLLLWSCTKHGMYSQNV